MNSLVIILLDFLMVLLGERLAARLGGKRKLEPKRHPESWPDHTHPH